MNQPSFSKLLMYVVIFLVVGAFLKNHFSENDEKKSQLENYEENEQSETVIYKAEIKDFRSYINNQPIKQIPIKVQLNEYETSEEYVAISNIMYCEYNADTKQVDIYIYDEPEPKKVSTTLKAINNEIGNQNFTYKLKNYIINFNYVTRVVTSNSMDASVKHKVVVGYKSEIKLDKNQKATFMRKLNNYKKYADPVN